ncbi:hypothetical protein DFH08DRAFT_810256 [Mycena albidolilacea]|uniref:Uncharacterized protein n=1 Tax=Mycena albidolilacea TaxID=1033008 RepID=A0AAD6ZZI7_9AGAR|nr:hypothetical protein DFH08DRAFT_810256 [Mycena albidolilacea]
MEDKAGAVRDDTGEVHSDRPGGMGEAGVVHAPVHNLGDILHTVHATGEAGGKVGKTEDMHRGVSKVAWQHAQRHGWHRGRCAQFGDVRNEEACTAGRTESGRIGWHSVTLRTNDCSLILLGRAEQGAAASGEPASAAKTNLKTCMVAAASVGLDTGQPAGTKHPTRTRTRHFRTRHGSGPKPVQVYLRVVIYPRVFRPAWVTRC